VGEGELVTAETKPQWSTSCLDWRERIVAGQSLVPFPPLFPSVAEAALRIFKELVVVDVAGKPKMGECCRNWVFDFVSAIFGAYDEEAGRRLITEFFLLISKKNTKSTSAAGIMLTALLVNWRHSAEFLVLAPTIEVANNSFFPARDAIRADVELDVLLHVQDHLRAITHRETGAVLKIVAADSETVSGKKATGILIDELWLLGKKQNAENMLREACGGLASRPEGFVVYLSTQSDEPPAGVFKQKLDYARGVRDGRIDDPCFLPVLYEFPEDFLEREDHKNPKNFYITNPNLGTSVDVPFLEREFKKAVETGESSLLGFMAKHLNVEVGLNLRSNRWAGADFWELCAASEVSSLDYLIEHSEVIVAGGDGGGLDDMLGQAFIGRDATTREWLLWTHAWIHPIALERRKENAEKYKDFEADGDLTIVSEIGEDIRQFGENIQKVEDSGLLDRVGVDPSGIGDILDELEERAIQKPDGTSEDNRVVGISQGWRLSGAIKTLERRVAEGTIKHSGSPLMNWCVGNAKVEPKGNAILITKQVSGTGKIDPLMATLMATALMALNPKARQRRSVYETRGVLAF